MQLGRIHLASRWLALCAASVLGCGSQFSDPIVSAEAQTVGGEAGAHGGPASCPSEWVAHFDGGSFVAAPRPIQDDFTIEAWISATSSAPAEFFGDASAVVFADVERVTANDFAAAIFNDKFLLSVGMPGADRAAVSTSIVTTGEWVHLAATRDKESGVIMVFVNGVLEGSAVNGTQTLGDEPTIHIGGRPPGRSFFTGWMSDVRLWNSVRSQAELLANMRRRLNGDEPGLVGYYRFDEHEGNLAHDSSPTLHDAEATGTLGWEQLSSPFCEP